MASRLVYPAVAVQREVERLVVLDDRLVERRQKHVRLVAFVDRSDHQTVVFAGIATNDGRAHVTALTVGCQHLPLQGILQIA